MYDSYKRWVLKQASAAQCSPALGVAASLIALGILCYFYRQVIITTLAVATVCIVCVVLILGFVAISIKIIKHERAKATYKTPATASLPYPGDDQVIEPDYDPQDTEAIDVIDSMTSEADVLAEEGTELSWSPDGKTLTTKKS